MKPDSRVFSSWMVKGVSVLLFLGAVSAQAAVRFTAVLRPEAVEAGERIEFQIQYEIEDEGTSAESPRFQAPDFDILMESPSVSVQATYDSNKGRFGQRVQRRFTYLLQAKRTGNLKITSIRGKVGSQAYSAPDVMVRVHGAGSAPNSNPQASDQRMGRGSSSQGSSSSGGYVGKGPEFFTRVEVEPKTLYKGQQAIVSYYLYVRGDTQAELGRVHKFPVLKGFFREELEMPVVQGNPPNEQVVQNGIPYTKHLLIRYAAYPLQEGNAIIDQLGLTLRYTRSTPMGGFGDEDDPFDPFGAFRRMVPGFGGAMGLRNWTQGTTQSDGQKVEVLPLPQVGKPEKFSGLVGQFTTTTVIDRTEVTAGQPITVVVKVEGRGNLSSLKTLEFDWPKGFEKYETKVQQKTSKDGLSQKIFETLVIPRRSGEFAVPAVKFNYFNPETASYAQGETEPLVLKVADSGVLGSNGVQPDDSTAARQGFSGGQTPGTGESWAILKEGDLASLERRPGIQNFGFRVARMLGLLLWGGAGALSLAIVWVTLKRQRQLRIQQERARGGVWTREQKQRWEDLRVAAERAKAQSDWESVLRVYDQIRGAVLQEAERVLPHQEIRGLPRGEVAERLLSAIPVLGWAELEAFDQVLQRAEDARFAARAGVMSESEIRTALLPTYEKGLQFSRRLSEIPLDQTPSPRL